MTPVGTEASVRRWPFTGVATLGMASFEHDGTTWRFCCTWCQEQFQAAPERFVDVG